MARMRVLELYSGIGGARAALDAWAAEHAVEVETASYDNNEHANTVYRHNFGCSPCTQGIEHLSVGQIDRMRSDLWLLSPPCQPHTLNGGRGGKGDLKDHRSDSLAHLCQLLRHTTHAPQFLLLENVPGFKDSEACVVLKEVLHTRGYTVRDTVLSPISFGIPNDRKRYYLLGSQSHLADVPMPEPATAPPTLAEFFDAAGVQRPAADEAGRLCVPGSMFSGHPEYKFDLAALSSRTTACFTKGYTESFRGSGSLLLMSGPLPPRDEEPQDGAQSCTQPQWLRGSALAELEEGRIRYFSAGELLALFGFPTRFTFPEGISRKQRYRLIGNSLNCTVHLHLLRHLLQPHAPAAEAS
eukprot:TRINITY_DN28612_c0_g1_i1.p1 TRINITY_DN28612_c0_g1~~TRINITY_DN28612_c0_g1_i1.p1  ORF type:complete len:378 (+),score=34.24 TRINITY_DN28612_c0_g1_i1:70-1134(+)